jgi:hypothetical protein
MFARKAFRRWLLSRVDPESDGEAFVIQRGACGLCGPLYVLAPFVRLSSLHRSEYRLLVRVAYRIRRPCTSQAAKASGHSGSVAVNDDSQRSTFVRPADDIERSISDLLRPT